MVVLLEKSKKCHEFYDSHYAIVIELLLAIIILKEEK